MKRSHVIFDMTKVFGMKGKMNKLGHGSFPSVEFDCAFCGKNLFDLKSCTNCWSVRYCDRTCQTRHWPQHRSACRNDPDKRNYHKGGRVVEFDYLSDSDIQEEGAKLNLTMAMCTKNGRNNHADFIPITDFAAQHLPPEIRCQEVAEYVRAEAKLTVNIRVGWTSKNRPMGDSCYKSRNTRNSRTASGTVIMDRPEEFRRVPCPIAHCHRKSDLGEDHDIWQGEMKIFTNKHVLFDDEELTATVVKFFFDSEDEEGVVKEYATNMYYNKRPTDRAFFFASVHDRSLLCRLEQLERDRGDSFMRIPLSVLTRMSAFAIIISHPHGIPKKVSIGQVVKVSEEEVKDQTLANAKRVGELEHRWFTTKSKEDYLKYIEALGSLEMPMYKVWYNTPTCPGSSGAPVLFGARAVNGTWGPNMGMHTAYECDSNLNFLKVSKFVV